MEPLLRNAALAAALATIPLAAVAQDHSHAHAATTPSTAGAVMTQGDVRKVDVREGTITLRHGPLENLGMPAMTMMFRVKDPAMLTKVKQGDQVKFLADNLKGELTVVRLEVQR